MKDNTEKFENVLSKLDKLNESVKKIPPSRKAVISIIKDIQILMFPDFFSKSDRNEMSRKELISALYRDMAEQILLSFDFSGKEIPEGKSAGGLALEIIDVLPTVKSRLLKDVTALYEGDPAATSKDEVILTYPGFYAISIYRIAHEFYLKGIPYLARIMTEYSHEKTGIDIHAGATIGDYFFIDHGTGIVIGETTTIGEHVKIYQGVTLGAKSFELDSDGNPVKGTKRHPDIGNNVIIYANATILGGSTVIGDGATIGGNVWLTRSVPAGSVIYFSSENKSKDIK